MNGENEPEKNFEKKVLGRMSSCKLMMGLDRQYSRRGNMSRHVLIFHALFRSFFKGQKRRKMWWRELWAICSAFLVCNEIIYEGKNGTKEKLYWP